MGSWPAWLVFPQYMSLKTASLVHVQWAGCCTHCSSCSQQYCMLVCLRAGTAYRCSEPWTALSCPFIATHLAPFPAKWCLWVAEFECCWWPRIKELYLGTWINAQKTDLRHWLWDSWAFDFRLLRLKNFVFRVSKAFWSKQGTEQIPNNGV